MVIILESAAMKSSEPWATRCSSPLPSAPAEHPTHGYFARSGYRLQRSRANLTPFTRQCYATYPLLPHYVHPFYHFTFRFSITFYEFTVTALNVRFGNYALRIHCNRTKYTRMYHLSLKHSKLFWFSITLYVFTIPTLNILFISFIIFGYA